MQQPATLPLPPNTKSPDSSPYLQETQSVGEINHHQQDQEQEKLQDGSRRKRKWEYNDETPTKSSIRSYFPPQPPRKPKSTPAMKRRVMWGKRSTVFLDVAREVESMFPPSVLQDFGKKIKKARS